MLTAGAVFSNHMVLQREKPIPVWGTADPRSKVFVSLGAETVTGVSSGNGRWMVYLPARDTARGMTMTVRCGQEQLEFSDISVGEVWLAGGQSNMELELINSLDGQRAVACSSNPDIRFYMTPKCAIAGEELAKMEAESGWKVCGPETSGVMSAVAWYFAKHIQAVKDIPVGIICCAWGGTSISCWMSREQLMKTAAGASYIEEYDALVGDKTEAQYRLEMEEYNREWEAWNDRVQERRKKDPTVSWEVLNEECGLCPWPQPAGRQSPFRPAGLYYTMVKRVCPYAIRGFLYYQGEEDEARHAVYDWMMISLISEWRQQWGDDRMPFLFVQLPMYIAKAEAAAGIDNRHWAMMRDQQMKVSRTVAGTGLAVLTDCGEFDNIHPLDKETVGFRLALQARSKVYGEDICADAPALQRTEFRDGKAYAHFEHTGGCLKVHGDKLSEFEIAGADRVFYPADGLIEVDTVVLWSEQVAEPAYLRYAWKNYCRPNLYGASGLPAAAFQASALSESFNE